MRGRRPGRTDVGRVVVSMLVVILLGAAPVSAAVSEERSVIHGTVRAWTSRPCSSRSGFTSILFLLHGPQDVQSEIAEISHDRRLPDGGPRRFRCESRD